MMSQSRSSQAHHGTGRATRGVAVLVLGALWVVSCSSGSSGDGASEGESGAAGEGRGGSAGSSGGGSPPGGSSQAGKGGGAGAGDAGSGGDAGSDDDGGSGGDAGNGDDTGTSGAGGADDSNDEVVAGPDEDVRQLDEDGGELAAGYARLIVPKGALSDPTEITLRRVRGDTVLDDVYEMRPSGLVFREQATFLLQVGEELAAEVPELERRALAYVDDPAHPRALRANLRLASAGIFAGAVWHFSDISAPVPDTTAPSAPFSDFGQALPYVIRSSCTGLDREFLQPDPGSKEYSAAETSVTCDYSGATYVAAPPQNGRPCVSIAIPPAARAPDVTVQYPVWENPKEACEDEWQDFLQRLEAHEREHRDIGLRGCEAAYDLVASSLPTACGKTEKQAAAKALAIFTREFTEALAPVQAAQDAIEVGKGHGVTMDCDCECEDECQRMDRATSKCVPIECDGECDRCVEGECVPDPEACEACVPATENHCPAGSSWDAGAGACLIDCSSGGTIAGLPCSFSGTSTGVLTGTSMSTTASVTLRAERFDGCAVLYEPVSGTVTATAPAPKCTYTPSSQPVEAITNECVFFVMPGDTPYLVGDCGSYWDGSIQCEDATAPTTIFGTWLYTLQHEMTEGAFTGTYTLNEYQFTFDFQPE